MLTAFHSVLYATDWFFFWYFNRLPERWWAMNAGQFSTPGNPLHINCGGIVGTGNRKDAAKWKM
jgi:hypothetical protein